MALEFWVAVITSVPTLIAAIVSIIVSNRLIGYRVTELDAKFDKLTSKVEAHNHLSERMAVVERDMKTAFNKLEEMSSDIKDLRK